MLRHSASPAVDDPEADDLSPEGDVSEDADVIGGMIDQAREEAMADEILLRLIRDDPAVVLESAPQHGVAPPKGRNGERATQDNAPASDADPVPAA